MRHPILPAKENPAILALCGGALWVLNAVWLLRDTRPPLWDMALHQVYALHYVPGFPTAEGLSFWQLSGNYPPLVHMFLALAFGLLGTSSDVGALINIPATLLLLWAVFQLGRHFVSSSAGTWACVLTVLTPYVVWMSRETTLDYWLSAWVACAWVMLIRCEGFESRRWSRVLGLVCAAGMLTKWMFLGHVVAPLFYVIVRQRIWRNGQRLRNALEALALAAIAAIWYVPNLRLLLRYFSENAQIGALEGEPPVLSLQSFIYYLRLLEGYQLYAILCLMVIGGGAVALARRTLREPQLLAACIAGGWLAMTLLRTKDPRFTLPLLGPLLILPAAWIASWKPSLRGSLARAALIAVLLGQIYATNFGISWLPKEVVLAEGYQGSLRWDWQLYSQHYFNVLGPPRREEWQQQAILTRIAEEAGRRGSSMSLGIVPDLPRFNTSNFMLAATARKTNIRIDRVRAAEPAAFDAFDFVLVTEGEQGMPWTTGESAAVNGFIRENPIMFEPAGEFALPNDDTARLYFVARRR